MEIPKDDLYYQRKIIIDILFIMKHTKNITFILFNENEVLQDSMLFRLIQISENSKKLSEEYRSAHNNIPWQQLAGLRNRIVHEYGRVDLKIIYNTLKIDIPETYKKISS